jgi:hypothetical protein
VSTSHKPHLDGELIEFAPVFVRPDSSPENSDSDTSDSDSDSDDSSAIEEFNPTKLRELLDSVDDEDEGGGSGGRLVTTHEVLSEEVAIPEITEVDPKETLERVGEILSVFQDKTVIVKGLASQIAGRASDRVLDTETLLVFEDRKVLGYVGLLSHPLPVRCLLLMPSLPYRFTRHSDRRANHSTKSDSTISFQWTRNGPKSPGRSSTCQVEVTSCLLTSSN